MRNILKHFDKSFVLKDYEEREADVIYKVKDGDKKCFLYIAGIAI